jgi:hypothetical protein
MSEYFTATNEKSNDGLQVGMTAELGSKQEATYSTGTSDPNTGCTVDASISVAAQSGVFIDTNISANKEGLNMATSVEVGDKVEVTAEASITNTLTDTGVSITGTTTVQSGTFVNASLEVDTHGVAADASASIGSSMGVSGTVTEAARYTSTTVGAGVSCGEELAIGGGAEATYNHGVVTVGVSGDVAALVGVNVDVSTSVNVGHVVEDGKVVVEKVQTVTAPVLSEVEKKANVIGQEAQKAESAVVQEAQKAEHVLVRGVKDVGNKMKKLFRF